MKRRSGFTLIEILTVVAVFSVVVLISINIFLFATRAQRRASDAQRTQGDIRFAMEAMGREVRFGAIEYSCYDSPDCVPEGAPSITPSTTVLATVDADGKRVRFRTAPDANGHTRLYVCVIAVPEEPLTKCNDQLEWEAVTPVGVRVERATFYITPSIDPFSPCDGGGHFSCAYPYLSNEQPRVTIILQTRQEGEELVPERISMQTTVTSHVYGR